MIKNYLKFLVLGILFLACSQYPTQDTYSLSDTPDACGLPDAATDAPTDAQPDGSIDAQVEEYSLAVISGQSNAVGATAGSTALSNVQYPSWMPYACHIGGASNPPRWGVHPWGGLGTRTSADGSNMLGPEIDLGRQLEAVQPGRWKLLKFAVSSSSMEHWNPTGTYPSLAPPNLFTQLVNRIKSAEIESGSKVRFILWLQGEADAATQYHANLHAARMETFLAALRQHFPNIVIVFGRLNDDFSGAYGSTVRAQQEILATKPGFYMVDMDGYPMAADRIHYPVSSHLLIGRAFANRYFVISP